MNLEVWVEAVESSRNFDDCARFDKLHGGEANGDEVPSVSVQDLLP